MTTFGNRVKTSKNEIIIHYERYGSEHSNYGELFDFLGDYDIITASEIGQDVIIMSGEVFLFRFEDERKLQKTSTVTLKKICSLEEYIDKNNVDDLEFLKWYY